ncbi:MAG: folylpolyglutamate synthase/dihydrofolate synthase family protein [Rickettsiales bacterium]|nr:MAG: folylpolyglutamate synthase/dihydrofolate synthase family protein [Rickettsiales bacterium]
MKKLGLFKYQLDPLFPRYGLDRIKQFFAMNDIDETKIPPMFHITGTNGKGSVTAFLKYILEANGNKVHRFTSPHIVEWNERIEIAGKMVSDEYALKIANEVKNFLDTNNIQLSWFEGIWAIACKMFNENPADACVVEVGLGGRLDGTNAFNSSLVSIITYISLDHCKTLGETRDLIAMEKAGIIKENGITIIGKQEEDAMQVFLQVAKEKNNKVYVYGIDWNVEKTDNGFVFKGFGKTITLPFPALEGEHQIQNAGCAIAGLLAQDKINIDESSFAKGIANTKWIGRLQNLTNSKIAEKYIKNGVELVIDGAHNDSGAKALNSWTKSKNKKKILILSMLNRKNGKLFVDNLQDSFDFVIACQLDDEEGSKAPETLKQYFLDNGYENIIAINSDFLYVLNYVKENFADDILIVCAGSLHFVGNILELEKEMGGDIYK